MWGGTSLTFALLLAASGSFHHQAHTLRLQNNMQASNQTTLVVYSGPTMPADAGGKSGLYHQNLRFFLKHGMKNTKGKVRTVVVITEGAEVDPELRSNSPGVEWLVRQNRCYDLESYRVALNHIGEDGLKAYGSFVFLNCGMVGPFLPSYAWRLNLHWSEFFVSRLTADVKLGASPSTARGMRAGTGRT